jgi:UDP-N-acetylglucosamine acyltransferase
VIIHPNVVIGNNNIIKTGTVIYPNTIIGDNNVFMEDNKIGTLPVEANKKYDDLSYNGLDIGDGNIFHVRNVISTGCYDRTRIGNDNKFLSDVFISHDNHIHNNVTFYPRVFSAGIVTYYSHASIGAGACIHQRLKVGGYSMIGMNNTIVRNVLPFMICINNRYSRLNLQKIDKDTATALTNIERSLIDDPSSVPSINDLPSNIQDIFNQILG